MFNKLIKMFKPKPQKVNKKIAERILIAKGMQGFDKSLLDLKYGK
jgi:hypothetical protein